MQPRGAVLRSVRLRLNAADPSEDAWHAEEDGAAKPFFPDRTITLNKDEQEQLVFDLHAGDRHQLCRAEFEMAVIDGKEELKQRINDQGRSIAVMTYASELKEFQRYRDVYVGGEVCSRFVEFRLHPESWAAGYWNACPEKYQLPAVPDLATPLR
jgi:hypothetical protein